MPTSAVGERRIAITHAVAHAWSWLHAEKKNSIIKAFEQTGISLPADGSQDHKLNIRGLLDFQIGPVPDLGPDSESESDSDSEYGSESDSDSEIEFIEQPAQVAYSSLSRISISSLCN